MAEGGGLLNRYRVKSSIGGSNPPLSATLQGKLLSVLPNPYTHTYNAPNPACAPSRLSGPEGAAGLDTGARQAGAAHAMAATAARNRITRHDDLEHLPGCAFFVSANNGKSQLHPPVRLGNHYKQRECLGGREHRESGFVHGVNAPIHDEVSRDSQQKKEVHAGVESTR